MQGVKHIARRIYGHDQMDERKRDLLLQIIIFLIISTLLVTKPLATSLLLNFYGAEVLPLAYGLIALVAVLSHYALRRASHSIPILRLAVVNLSAHATIFLAIALVFYRDYLSAGLSLAFYVYVSLFALLSVTYFYQYCHSLLTIREAKKTISRIGVGAIAGGVFGGYYAYGAVNYIGNTGLVLSGVCFIGTALFLLLIVHKKYGGHYSQRLKKVSKVRTRSIWRIRHVRNIALIIGLGVVVAKLVDYQFNYVASLHMTSADALTSFFGFWYSSLNILGLLIQSVFTRRFIDRFGITVGMSVMPILLLVATVGIIVAPVLACAVILKSAEGSLKQSLYKTSTEINIMALAKRVREKAKTMVDVVIDSLATGVAGGLIYACINYWELPLWSIASLSVVLCVVWIFMIFRSKESYLYQLRRKVMSAHQRPEASLHPAEILASRQTSEQTPKDATGSEGLEYYLRHPSLVVQLSFLKNYLENNSPFQFTPAQKATILAHESIEMRMSYMMAVLKEVSGMVAYQEYYDTLTRENQYVLTAVLASIVKDDLDHMAYSSVYAQLEKWWHNDARAAADRGDRYRPDGASDSRQDHYPLTRMELKSLYLASMYAGHPSGKAQLRRFSPSDEEEMIAALWAIHRARPDGYLPLLIRMEAPEPCRQEWYKALSVYLPELLVYLKTLKRRQWEHELALLPALEVSGDQSAMNYLIKCLDHPKLPLRRKAMMLINDLRASHPEISFGRGKVKKRFKSELRQAKLIVRALQTIQIGDQLGNKVTDHVSLSDTRRLRQRKQSVTLSIFVMLGLLTKRNDIHLVYYALRRGKSEEVLDYLDQILTYKMRQRVLPILELLTQDDWKSDVVKPLKPRQLYRFLRSISSQKVSKRQTRPLGAYMKSSMR